MLRFLFLLFAGAASGWAGGVRLTLESAPRYASEHNPALAAARLRIEEARGRVRQSGRLSNPELEVDLSRNVRAAEGSVGVALTQRFPLTARLRLERAVTAAELRVAEAEVRNAEREVAADVSTALVKLLALEGLKGVRERQMENGRDLLEFTRRRVQAGEAPAVEASLLELESRQWQGEIAQLEVERATVMGQLRPLLGMSAQETPLLSGSLPAAGPVPERAGAGAERADLQAARETAEAAKQSATLARAQRWQDVGVGVNVSHQREEDAPEGYQRDTFVGVRLSVPLPVWNANTGKIQEAGATAARTRQEAEALALKIGAEAEAAREAMAALKKLIAVLEGEVLPMARQVEEQWQSSFTAGLGHMAEVLRARDRRVAVERQRIEALRDFHLARVRYAAATGNF